MHPHQRSIRNFLIEPLAQIRMGVRLLAINIAFLVAMIFVITSGFFAQYTLLLQKTTPAEHTVYDILMEVFIRHTIALSVVFLLFIIVLMGAVVVYTHRIYGAVINLRRFISDLTHGHYDKRCQLRASDELQELATDLNLLAESLQSRKPAPPAP